MIFGSAVYSFGLSNLLRLRGIQCDTIVKAAFTSAILGLPLPTDFFPMPMVVVTKENMYTEKLFGATFIYPWMPADYNLWPVLDTTAGMLLDGNTYTEIPGGLPTPTLEMRRELLGY